MRIRPIAYSPLKLIALITGIAVLMVACSGDPTATMTPRPTPTSASSGGSQPTPTATPTPAPDREALAADHFAGRTITVMAGYAPGGGQDANARVTSKHLSKHIPGNPRIIVSNLTGADGLIAGQRVMSRPADGTNIVLVNNVLTQQQSISGQPAPGFDLFNSIYLGNVQITTPGSSATLCARGDIAQNWDQLFAKAAELGRPLRAGVFRAGSWGVILPKYFDIPVQPVPGFTGTATILQGIDQEELEVLVDACTFDQLTRARPDWIEEGNVVYPIVNYQGLDLGPAQSMFDTSGWDVPPTLEEVMELTDFQTRLLDVARQMATLTTHPWVIHGETPDYIAETLRQALEDVTQDPDYIADMARINRIAGYTHGNDYANYRDSVREAAAGDLTQAVKDFAGIVD